ncbi:sugar O-acetyltransferase [Alteromonas sediminis]|uniref:Acetyltransferase n=1 Tax=Alteromonas sediminis TaxID=2259342 RepID=A0A3N5XWM4_9ALTE|nr:sugar O-acetyltransferase [Alteromonas sediminis]RPJ65092.1 sugar O-acetyltransferase [Alteromonas sediminis]
MSEKQKMQEGLVYNPLDKELVALRMRARRIVDRINSTPMTKKGDRKSQFESLFGSTGRGFYIESPFHCDYGENITIGDRFFANFGCVILDAAPVTIGNNCKLGPQVGLYTATHPVEPEARIRGEEYALPIILGDNVWIGGNATINPGVRLGDNVVVGAGAVVTRSFDNNCVIAGNPARLIRKACSKDFDVSCQQSSHSVPRSEE